MNFKNYIFLIFINIILCQLHWYNHSELEWKTIETENFKIHYHQGTENSAKEAASVAEYIYPHVTALYDYYPSDKTEIIIKDVDDYTQFGNSMKANAIQLNTHPTKLSISLLLPIQRKNDKYILQIFFKEPFSTALISASWDGIYNPRRHVRR